MMGWLKANIGQDILVADESRRAVVTTGSAAGTNGTIATGTTPPWLTGVVAARVPGADQFLIDVAPTVGGFTIVGAAPAIPAGTSLYPALQGRFPSTVDIELVTDGVVSGSITFNVTPLTEVETNPAAAPVVFNGREVFLMRPNWMTNPKVTFSNDYETVDYGYGALAYFNPISFVSRAQQASYLAMTHQQMVAIEDMYFRLHGQLGEFLLPTWQNDIIPQAPVAAGATSFLAPSDLYTDFVGDTVFDAFCAAYGDGSYQFGLVTSIGQNGSFAQINIGATALCSPAGATTNSAAGLARALDNTVTSISWMPVHRFASDKLISEWITDSVAQTQLSVISLQDLSPGK